MARRRLSIRWRFTLSATALIVITGGVMLALVNVFMSYAPQGDFPLVSAYEPSEDIPLIELTPDSPYWDPDGASYCQSDENPWTDVADKSTTMTYSAGPSSSWVHLDPPLMDFFGPIDTKEWWVISSSGGEYDDQNYVSMWTTRITTGHDVMSSLMKLSGIVLAVLAVIAGAVAWWWSGRVLRPVTEVAQAVHKADASTLDQRINWQGPKDEIKTLADDVDGMLDRLERSFAVQRQFSANASHELITPLSTSQALIDVTLTGNDISEDERDVLTKLQGLGTRSLGTIAALMRFAEADSVPLERDRVEVSPLISGIVTSSASSADDHGVTIHWDPDADPVAVDADDALLARALDNLVDNAIVHNLPAGGVAWIHTTTDDGQAVIEIENTGDPLTDEQVASLGQPFYRAAGRVAGDAADPTSGHGLGLALARSIVEAHGGTLVVASREGGRLTATVRLPLATT